MFSKRIFIFLSYLFIILKFTSLLFAESPVFIRLKAGSIYFSPNNDGEKDTITFQIEKLSEEFEVTDWRLDIHVESGTLVKSFHADKRHKRRNSSVYYLFSKDSQLEENKIRLPEKLEWSGTDLSGLVPKDGIYYAVLQYKDNAGALRFTRPTYFYLDSKAPYADLQCNRRFFSPDKDGIYDTLEIQHKLKADKKDRWRGSFLDEKGKELRSFVWETQNLPETIHWDGKDDRGIMQETGLYYYRLSGEDFSGNIREYKLGPLSLRKDSVNIDVNVNQNEFSPNGDKYRDILVFFPQKPDSLEIDSYSLKIYKAGSEKKGAEREFSGENILPSFINWDGKNAGNKVLEGKYLYRLDLKKGDKLYSSLPKELVIHTEQMHIYFGINHENFTPDNDGERDILEIYPELENLNMQNWEVVLVERYILHKKSRIRVLKRWKGHEKIAKRLVWDGISNEGVALSSLARLELYFYFTNDLEEKKYFQVKKFQSGISVRQVKGDYK
ncbi:MAG: hypothetical protein KDK45_24120, partial [Leptospiraceae bacterium]|nr:hypothetical protein [Leptospiraceae bacterium]